MKPMVSEAAPASPDTQRHATEMVTSQVAPMIEKYLVTHAGGELFIDHGSEVGNDTRDFVRGLVEKYGRPNQFASEEVSSNYTYPSEYTGPKFIVKQIHALAKIFGLDPTSAITYATIVVPTVLREGTEGRFAVPSVSAIARVHFPGIKDPAEQYVRALDFALTKLAESRTFYNYRDGQLTAARLRRTTRTATALAKIAEAQGNPDILVIDAQFGKKHAGRSVRRSREVFTPGEFGLGALEVVSMLLVHPEREVKWEQLHVDCPGDEFDDPDSDVRFDRAPLVDFSGSEVRFGTSRFDDAYDQYGSASGVSPQ